jgi:hypothetical protein
VFIVGDTATSTTTTTTTTTTSIYHYHLPNYLSSTVIIDRAVHQRLSPLCRAWAIKSILRATATDDVHRRDIEEGGREGGV